MNKESDRATCGRVNYRNASVNDRKEISCGCFQSPAMSIILDLSNNNYKKTEFKEDM